MNTLILTRFAKTPFGIFGRYRLLNGDRQYTLEPFNCIPSDVYTCVPDRYNKGGYAASEVQNVPERSQILHHIGNTTADTTGCILHGRILTYIEGMWAIGNSTAAFSLFMTDYGDKKFLLDIRNDY